MAIEIVRTEQNEIQFNEEQISIIKKTVATGATDVELQMFLHQCQRTGLDPLLKQIHFIKRKSWDAASNGYIEKATIQAGIDELRLIADRTGKYAPGDPPEYQYRNNQLFSVKVNIKKLVKDQWFNVWGGAFYSEYVQTKGGQPIALWKSKPHVMLAKCAESAALRRGFPAELSGVYSHDEMPENDEAPTRLPEQKKQIASAPAPDPDELKQAQDELYMLLTGTGVDQAEAVKQINEISNNLDMLNIRIDEIKNKIDGGE